MPDKSSTSGSSVGAQAITGLGTIAPGPVQAIVFTGRAGADRCARNWANPIVRRGPKRAGPRRAQCRQGGIHLSQVVRGLRSDWSPPVAAVVGQAASQAVWAARRYVRLESMVPYHPWAVGCA